MPPNATIAPPVTLRQRISAIGLRRFMWLLALAMIGVVIFFGGLSYYLLQQQLITLRNHELERSLNLTEEVIAQRLLFYRDVVNGYVREPSVIDLLQFPDSEASLAWSRRVRDSLPSAVGAALFSAAGEIHGDPISQQVGEQCLTDLQLRIARSGFDEPPLIHDQRETLAHFDISAPVYDGDGEMVGLVFISFALEELERVLNRLANRHSAAALIDLHGDHTIAISDNWDQLRADHQLQSPVGGANWQLRLRFSDVIELPELPAVGIAIIVGMCSVVLLILIAGRILIRSYFNEVEDIQQILQRILQGESLNPEELQSHHNFFPLGSELRAELQQLGAAHAHLQQKSLHDAMTGLANRHAFDQRFADLLHCLNEPPAAQGFCLVLLDLDHFKQVNDCFGHAVGDAVLLALSSVLKERVREGDLVSRWGGDEFAVLLPNMPESAYPGWLARVRASFDEAQQQIPELRCDRCRCGVSSGYIWVNADDQQSASDWLQHADRRLYEDKVIRRQPPSVVVQPPEWRAAHCSPDPEQPCQALSAVTVGTKSPDGVR